MLLLDNQSVLVERNDLFLWFFFFFQLLNIFVVLMVRILKNVAKPDNNFKKKVSDYSKREGKKIFIIPSL